ncbi:MAG: host attachment protein [Caulobacter sp.]|nr:host attachment protein [Caulobacter sp.]
MILPTGATVAVVDGGKLLMFHNTGHETVTLSPLPAPAITSGGVSTGHRVTAGNPDHDAHDEDGFAAGVAAMLNAQALSGKLGDLVVIAAPRTLGELRKHWHKALQAKLVGEIAKDLTGQTPDHIAAAIAKA